MNQPYPIIHVTSEMRNAVEQLGSKPKFWFKHNGENWLFKEARKDSGEDWAEKVASEIATELGIGTHHTELALSEGKRGCAVRSFITSNNVVLIHGNELLGGVLDDYDEKKERGQSQHTFENIVAAIDGTFVTDSGRRSAAGRMTGYLVFDALVGNTDRHHQNWGVLLELKMVNEKPSLRLEIAPTFDHASSLGRELTDDRRQRYLKEHSLEQYIRNGKGGIFESIESKRGMCPMAVVELIAKHYPELFKQWQTRLINLPEQFWSEIVNRVPDTRISEQGRRFVNELLTTSRQMIQQIP